MMKNYPFVYRSFLMFSLCFGSFSIFGQNLLESRKSSLYTYIYKITDKEAAAIYKKSAWEIDTSFFHSLVDSFLTDNNKRDLAQGHYIKTWAAGGTQKMAITSIHNLQAFVLNNSSDLSVRVFDLKGEIIEHAELKIGWKKLRFDKQTQTYVDEKSNRKGLLEITFSGMTSYFLLDRQLNNPTFKRGFRTVVYGTPLKYVWRPIRFTALLPVDGVKSVINRYPQGTIARSAWIARRAYNGIACLFDKSYCGNFRRQGKRRQYTGYLAFNKPRYLPGDTVKFKAFIINKKGKPLDEDLSVVLWGHQQNLELTKLSPYREGGYSWEFVLHDSLQLKLDKGYTLMLMKNLKRRYISGNFYYEDYELSKQELALRTERESCFRGQEMAMYLKGIDENGLNLLDARVELILLRQNIHQYLDSSLFVPDTLLTLKQKLKPSGETKIILPDSIFPAVNMDFLARVRLLSSDNESVEEVKRLSFYHKRSEIESILNQDSIRFDYRQNGISLPEKINVYGKDIYGNKTSLFEGVSPVVVKLDPVYDSYCVNAGQVRDSIDVSTFASLIQCGSERTRDSVLIVISNPRNIAFNYNIYKGNRAVASGIGKTLDYKARSFSRKDYFISLQYLWGGKVKEEAYKIPLLDKKLNVEVLQPRMVYPGQKAEIRVEVTDIKGKPVSDVDLTAYGLTGKFKSHQPNVPYLGKTRKRKKLINKFDIKDKPHEDRNIHLDYEKWRSLASLDTIEYYKFLYPENGVYRFEYTPEDTLTQFAPYVVSRGTVLPVHVVYLDSKPVYFSWSEHERPYAFKVTPGYHQIKLRTSDRNITLDSIYFNKGQKLIFSIEKDVSLKHVKSQKAPVQLNSHEKNLLHRYILPFRFDFKDEFAIISKQDHLIYLRPDLPYNRSYYRQYLAGPIAGDLTFELIDSFSIKFRHEPYYEYFFAPSLLKMKSVDKDRYPGYLYSYNPKMPFTDLTFTRATLINKMRLQELGHRIKAMKGSYPGKTAEGSGSLIIDHPRFKNEDPFDILLWCQEYPDFQRIYKGNVRHFHELRQGHYKVMFMYADSRYYMTDLIFVKSNGITYKAIDIPETLDRDAFSIGIDSLINKLIFDKGLENPIRMEQIKTLYRKTNVDYSSSSRVINGRIYDDTGEPLIGVSVLVKGTNIGAVSDFDGYYEIVLPPGHNDLIFSYTGYASVEIAEIGHTEVVDVNMNQGVQLNAVIITGYRAPLIEQDHTTQGRAVVALNLKNVQGVAAGASMENYLAGAVSGGIKLSGNSSLLGKEALLVIIDGSVFTGDITAFDPDLIKTVELLEGENAVALYGSRAQNGVLIIETKNGNFRKDTNNTEEELFLDNSLLELNGIRSNFSDYAFWRPQLITDKNGRANFKVTFPDDVTSWDTYFLAMNGKFSGQGSGRIKSYKPLMGQLAIPRFLVEGDTTYAIGKALNYMPQEVEVKRQFEINDQKQFEKQQLVVDALIDSLEIVAVNLDTLAIKYFIEKSDGYLDGELRKIPVFPIGLEKTEGQFHILDKDTTITTVFNPQFGEVTLTAKANVLKVIEEDINYLVDYKYSCNEQLASKLKALLARKTIAHYQGKSFEFDNDISKIIRLLEKRQKSSGLWGWWAKSMDSYWISFHVLEAILEAKTQGFSVGIQWDSLKEILIWKLETNKDFSEKIRILKMLHLLESSINTQTYIETLDTTIDLSLNEMLQIIHVKQLYHQEYDLDTLDHFQQSTIFGNIYYGKESHSRNLLVNKLQNTLLVYKILKADSADHSAKLQKIRNYFLEQRLDGRWGNTYAAARIVETILPDLLKGKDQLSKPKLVIKGEVEREISAFPFKMTVTPETQLVISKTGDLPVYFSTHQYYWERKPQVDNDDFEITSKLREKLEAGKRTTLEVTVNVKKDAKYVMVNVPIPAGCSYANKKRGHWREVHREYFKNETAIFYEDMPQGIYTIQIELIPRYTGTYTLNPAKAELMYFPVFNGNNELKKIKIVANK